MNMAYADADRCADAVGAVGAVCSDGSNDPFTGDMKFHGNGSGAASLLNFALGVNASKGRMA